MRFQPKTEAELSNLIPDGIYPFEIIEAVERESKNGNGMIALKLSVHHNDTARGVLDYLVDIDSMAYKTRHFSEAVGMLAEYEKGSLDAERLQGLTGKCKIGTQPAKDGYEAKNTVKDYVPRKSGAEVVQVPKKGMKIAEDGFDDSIPF